MIRRKTRLNLGVEGSASLALITLIVSLITLIVSLITLIGGQNMAMITLILGRTKYSAAYTDFGGR